MQVHRNCGGQFNETVVGRGYVLTCRRCRQPVRSITEIEDRPRRFGGFTTDELRQFVAAYRAQQLSAALHDEVREELGYREVVDS